MSNGDVVDVDQFLKLVVNSGLVREDELRHSFDAFLGGARSPASRGSDLLAFGDFLVWQGHLTYWQCRMLRKRRWKDFFLGQYKFMEQVTVARGQDCYLVEDMLAKRKLLVSFSDRRTDDAGTICTFKVLSEQD